MRASYTTQFRHSIEWWSPFNLHCSIKEYAFDSVTKLNLFRMINKITEYKFVRSMGLNGLLFKIITLNSKLFRFKKK